MKLSTLLLFVIVASLSLGVAAAQAPPADTLSVNYFVNANTGYPDGTVRIINPGTSGGNLCALIYVFYPDEEMAECCGCTTTPDDLRTLSINNNLTANPLTSVVPTNGAIKIVSSASAGACDPRHINATPALRAWGTHIQSANTITETEFLDATLSTKEVSMLQRGCSAIMLEGSGHGVCNCGMGY